MTNKNNKYESGANWGGWTLLKKLGEGGDAEVWEALSEHTVCAIKILKTNDPEKLLRFKQEISLVKDCKDINGIIKLIDCDSSEHPMWFTMPIAENSFDFVREIDISEKIRLVLTVADALIGLHQKNIAHRDIKPSNILLFDNKLILSDLGFAHHPERDVDTTILSERRGIGAIATSAPEMRRYSKKDYQVNDFKPADVYSLAKTLWVYLTGKKLGFDGEYSSNSIFSLKNHLNNDLHELLPSIDNLLIQSTKEDPLQRPSIQSFRNELLNILQNIDNFEKYNHIHWLSVINEVFPMSIPQYAKWENIDDVFKIFSKLISVQHYVYPVCGRDTFTGIKHKNEKIEFLTTTNSSLLIKNPILTFNSFEKNPTLNYFRLECEYKHNRNFKNGIFVFFSKSSLYNKYQNEEGRHNAVGEQEFRKTIESLV